MSVLVVAGAFFALLLAIRLVAFPQIENRRGEIAQWLSARIGQPVELDAIETAWDGWNPKLEVRGFRVRDRQHDEGILLELPRVDLSIAWTSLPLLDLRLKELVIEGPRLSVRRDAAGKLHLAGMEVEHDAQVQDTALADWLMRQPEIVVRDALVAWNDEYRRAPQLLLDHVDFRLQQRFGRHHAGLTGVPPPEIASPLELRVDVSGHSLNDWSRLRGRMYMRLDYADFGAWREWLPLPFAVDSGRGAFRAWVDFAQSQPVGVTADFELDDARATVRDGLAPLEFAHLAGRAVWKRTADKTELTAREVSFTLPTGVAHPPADFTLTVAGGDRATGGKFVFSELALAPLAAIAPQLPIGESLQREIGLYVPRGTLRNGTFEWVGAIDAPERFSAKTEFRDAGVAATEAHPGVVNLAGSVEVSERGGQLRLDSHKATLALPHVFAEPLAFETLRGDVGWKRDAEATTVTLTNVAFANGDAAGTAAGTWRSRANGPGEINVKAELTRAHIASTWRYVPVGAGATVRDWLHRALVAGTSNDAKLVLEGDLAQFPFAGGKGGRFLLTAKTQDASLEYAHDWPPITAIAGDVRVDGTRLAVTASSARSLGAEIGPTRAEIADFHAAAPVLRIAGTAKAGTARFLEFIAKTPIDAWTDRVTRGATADGDGKLSLEFDLPLHDFAAVRIAGQYTFADNAIRLAGVPPLSAAGGTIEFTERSVRAGNVAGEALGGPLKLDVASEGGRVRINASGTADLDAVRREYPGPLIDRVTGRTDWQLAFDARDQRAAWTLESSLQGAAIDLPAPLRKVAADRMPLRIERRDATASEDRIAISLGSAVRGALHRQIGTDGARIDRALIQVGKAASEPAMAEQPGVWIRGDVDALSLDDWLAVDMRGSDAPSTGDTSAALQLNGVDLAAGTLDALGRRFTRLTTSARRQGNDWRLTLDGAELAGTAVWRGATPAQPNGRLAARLSRLAVPHGAESRGTSAADAGAGANRWPEVDVVADALRSKERTLGKLELAANPAGDDWQIRKLSLVNDHGRIDAHGAWRNVASRSSTALEVAIDVKEAGEFLSRFGWPNAVRGAPTKINGRLEWEGAPSDFDYPSLSGTFKLNSGAGQFTKIDPGVGRLLGVLSLQMLPRRISLDFRDVFSEGFAFDTITGEVRMRNGVMHTDDFRLVGPAAAVNIAGDADIARETQALRVRVQPAMSSGVSVGTAALFIANPLVGAAVGAGTLLAQKMLNNPFDQLFSYEYSVTGSFDDPVVTRVTAAPATAQSGASVR
jgi:uncharacterized protein (TIGR02099 family)